MSFVWIFDRPSTAALLAGAKPHCRAREQNMGPPTEDPKQMKAGKLQVLQELTFHQSPRGHPTISITWLL